MNEKESLFTEERRQKILELLSNNEKVTVAQLCSHFNMSSATIRNDLRELDASGLLKRTHGGAMANTKLSFEADTKRKETINIDEKQSIAQAALELIDDGDTIILDTGTTTLELARRLSEKKNITVLTNDLQIALSLEEFANTNVLFIGGIIKKRFHCTVGLIGCDMLANLIVDKAFMGTNGITLSKGVTTPDIVQAEIKKAMIKISNKVIILSDNSKFGRNSFAQFAAIEEIDTIVTDNLIGTEKEKYEAIGIEVVVAQILTGNLNR